MAFQNTVPVKPQTNYGYDRNVDYSQLIADAVKNGDMARAAIYEAQRNEKIAGEGMNYQPTSRYSTFLPGSYTGGGYTNPYQKDLDAILKRVQDGSAYRKQYLREADRTIQDTLAQYGTMTGGIPSTQAVAAASQAGDYYKSQLADKLADLDYQNANLLLAAGNQAASDYQLRISDAMNRWTQLGYADDEVAQILGVAIGTPTSDQSYLNWQRGWQEQQAGTALDQQNWEREQQAKSDAYNLAMTLLQAGQMPDANTLATAGISENDANALLSAVMAAGSGYSGGGGSGKGKLLSLSDLQALGEKYAQSGYNSEVLDSYIDYYLRSGYDVEYILNWIGSYYRQEPEDGYASGWWRQFMNGWRGATGGLGGTGNAGSAGGTYRSDGAGSKIRTTQLPAIK